MEGSNRLDVEASINSHRAFVLSGRVRAHQSLKHTFGFGLKFSSYLLCTLFLEQVGNP